MVGVNLHMGLMVNGKARFYFHQAVLAFPFR